jgi:iron complex transport system permease protein
LNVLVLGDDACAALGVSAGRLRWQLLVLTILLTGTVVAVSGGIGFVGLIIGHMARMAVGADHRRALPVTVLLGAIFLVWSDVLARMVITPAELPIGVVTAFLGVPLFLLVMRVQCRDDRDDDAGGDAPTSVQGGDQVVVLCGGQGGVDVRRAHTCCGLVELI